jgi:hypothetical protein
VIRQVVLILVLTLPAVSFAHNRDAPIGLAVWMLGQAGGKGELVTLTTAWTSWTEFSFKSARGSHDAPGLPT